jgi:hypothetical protein
MSPANFSKFTHGNLKWLSRLNGLVLLNWDFTPQQIKLVWSYRDINVLAAKPHEFCQSAIYISSGFVIEQVPSTHVLYNGSYTREQQLPRFTTAEKQYLSHFPNSTLRKWGFSQRLLIEIRAVDADYDGITLKPRWLETCIKYQDSGFSLNNTPQTPQPAQPHGLNPTTVMPSWAQPNPGGFSPGQINVLAANYGAGTSAVNPLSQLPDELFGEITSSDDDFDDDEQEQSAPISSLTGDTPHDLQVKYQGTYGRHKGRPCLFIDANNSNSAPLKYEVHGYYYKDSGAIDSSFISTDMSEFDMTVPKLGFINHDNCVILLERRHKKSSPCRYRRALRSDGVLINGLSAAEYIEAFNKPYPYNPNEYGEDRVMQKILNSVFNPKFFSYAQALEEVSTFKRLSAAISSSLALALDFKADKLYLYKYQWPIGIYDFKKSGFNMSIDIFNDDIQKAGVIIL